MGQSTGGTVATDSAKPVRAGRLVALLLGTLLATIGGIAIFLTVNNNSISLSCTANQVRQTFVVPQISLGNLLGNQAIPTYRQTVDNPIETCRGLLGPALEDAQANHEIDGLRTTGQSCGLIHDTASGRQWYYRPVNGGYEVTNQAPPTPLPQSCPRTDITTPSIAGFKGTACRGDGSITVTLDQTQPTCPTGKQRS